MSDTFRDIVLNRLFGGGREPSPQPHRTPADVALGSPLGGDYIPSNMSNINPTNAKAFGRETMKYGLAAPWYDPIWMTPARHGHNRSLQRDMERMSQMQVAEQYRADEQALSQLYAGSVNPIYYPPPVPVPPAASYNDRASVLSQHTAPVSPYSGPGGYGGTTPGSVPVDPSSVPPDALMQFLRGLQGR